LHIQVLRSSAFDGFGTSKSSESSCSLFKHIKAAKKQGDLPGIFMGAVPVTAGYSIA
jgi:hypothetical protein